MTLLEVANVSKSFRGLRAVDDVSFTVEEGTILGIIGPNGAGKTTLFNCVAGAVTPDTGTVHLGGADVTGAAPHKVSRAGMARTFQLMKPFGSMSVLENVAVAVVRFLRQEPSSAVTSVGSTPSTLRILSRSAFSW